MGSSTIFILYVIVIMLNCIFIIKPLTIKHSLLLVSNTTEKHTKYNHQPHTHTHGTQLSTCKRRPRWCVQSASPPLAFRQLRFVCALLPIIGTRIFFFFNFIIHPTLLYMFLQLFSASSWIG